MNAVTQQRLIDRRHRAYCCGCIHSGASVFLICIAWAALSFFFAVWSFQSKSPFTSRPDIISVPTILFGTVNLAFGVVTLACMLSFLIKGRREIRFSKFGNWTLPLSIINQKTETHKEILALMFTGLAVLIMTLVTFIFFALEKQNFINACAQDAANYTNTIYQNQTMPSASVAESSSDTYSCGRLFQDELKWFLLCLIVMIVVYVHWILIISARKTYTYFFLQNATMINQQVVVNQQAIQEMANVGPSKRNNKKASQITESYRNLIPSRNTWKNLLTHRQYEAFGQNDGFVTVETPAEHQESKEITRPMHDSFSQKTLNEIILPDSAHCKETISNDSRHSK